MFYPVRFAIRNVYDKLVKIAGRPAFLPAYLKEYLGKKTLETAPLVVVSYPKSGRTWLRMLLVSYYSFKTENRVTDWNLLERGAVAPPVTFTHDCGNWVPAPCRYTRCRIKKDYGNKKIIFLVRDPRDVLVSSWYHLTYREPILREPLDGYVSNPWLGIRKVIAFMNLWRGYLDTHPCSMTLYYEELKKDPATGLRSILQFLGEPEIHEEALLAAVEESTFTKMQQRESATHLSVPWLQPGNPRDARSRKIRSGTSGTWRTHFSEETCASLNEQVARLLDPRLGYKDPAIC